MTLMLEQPAAGLFLDPGLGKTSITLGAFSILKSQGIVDRMLVVAPLRVATSVWPDEAARWQEFTGLRVAVLHGGRKREALQANADVFTVNPEGLPWLDRQKWNFPTMLVVDESTKFKHTRTERFKILRRWLPKFQRRYILTGTPAPNGLMDLFGQVYILDFGERLGEYITRYRQTYFFQTGYGGYTWVPRPGAEADIYAKLGEITLRLDAEDWLKMPKRIETTIGIDLPVGAAKAYGKLEEHFTIQLSKGEVTAVNVGALSAKLRQLANGAVYLDDDVDPTLPVLSRDRRFDEVHDAKLDALEDLVEELSGQPLLVAYSFTHDVARIQGRLGHLYRNEPIPVIGAGATAKASNVAIERWNRGELPLMLIHPASGGHGLNLQRGGNHLAWFGLTYDLEHYDQLTRRLWRQGQQKPVFVYHLVAKRTIDTVIADVIRRKARKQSELLEALREKYVTGKKP